MCIFLEADNLYGRSEKIGDLDTSAHEATCAEHGRFPLPPPSEVLCASSRLGARFTKVFDVSHSVYVNPRANREAPLAAAANNPPTLTTRDLTCAVVVQQFGSSQL